MAIALASSAVVADDAYHYAALDSGAKTVHMSDEQKVDADGVPLWVVTIKRTDREGRKTFLEVTVPSPTAPPESGQVRLPGLTMNYSAPRAGGGWSGIYWSAEACIPVTATKVAQQPAAPSVAS